MTDQEATQAAHQGEAPQTTPETKLSPEAQAAADDKAQMGKFMEAMAKHGVEGAEVPKEPEKPKAGPERGADGKFAPKGENGRLDGVEPDGEPKQPGQPDKDLEAALHALRRDHYTSEQIELLGDEDAIKKFAKPLIKKQAADDQAHTKVRELEKALEEATSKARAEGVGVEQQTPPATQPAPSLDKIKASLGDAFGETDAEVLTEALKHVADLSAPKVAALEASLGEYKSALEQMQGIVFEMQMESVMREAEGRFPGLADKENRQSVRAQLLKLNPDAYQNASLVEMVEDAARMLGMGGQSGNGTPRRTSDLNSLKDAGRTATPAANAAPPVQKDSGFEEFKRHMAKAGFQP